MPRGDEPTGTCGNRFLKSWNIIFAPGLEHGRRLDHAAVAAIRPKTGRSRLRREDPSAEQIMVNANAIAIAGGAIAASLIDTLTSKGLLTADEAAALGARALMLLTPYTMTSSDADGACRIITDMLVGPRPGA
jgi:hypothetical protein